MILLIDNYDSFTYNLYQALCSLGEQVVVHRNDQISISEIRLLSPDQIVISPGPCTPDEAGISVEIVREFSGRIPILGVCLGHQSIGAAYGAAVVGAPEIVHGKTSEITHRGSDLFSGVPDTFTATRYHSLIVEESTLPECLTVTARTSDGLMMAMEHREHDVYGVQFHPESILTTHGPRILANFVRTDVSVAPVHGY